MRAVVPNQVAAAILVARSDSATPLCALVSKQFALSIRSVLPVDLRPAPLPLAPLDVAMAAHAWLRSKVVEVTKNLRL